MKSFLLRVFNIPLVFFRWTKETLSRHTVMLLLSTLSCWHLSCYGNDCSRGRFLSQNWNQGGVNEPFQHSATTNTATGIFSTQTFVEMRSYSYSLLLPLFPNLTPVSYSKHTVSMRWMTGWQIVKNEITIPQQLAEKLPLSTRLLYMRERGHQYISSCLWQRMFAYCR